MLIAKKMFYNAEEVTAFFSHYTGLCIDQVHNIGDFNFAEMPLFIVSKECVFLVFFSDYSAYLTVYERAEYDRYLYDGIFRDPENPDDFSYIYPEARQVQAQLLNVTCKTDSFNGTTHLTEISLHFSSGKSIHIHPSKEVEGTMVSWLE